MANPLQHSSQSAVLHICGPALAPSGEAQEVEKWIVEAGLEAARCDDVYMGLAKAMGKSSGQFVAVIVCVEDCSPGDYEFFAILARTRRDLPVHVYGSKSPDRIVRALESGARGLASREAVLALSSRRRFDADSLRPESESPAILSCFEPPPCEIVEPAEPSEHVNENVASNGEIEDEDPVAPEAESDASARVPWLRYSGAPERKRPSPNNTERPVARGEPPSTVPKVSNGSAKPPPGPSCERSYEPLLTEQELAALLGDDLDDLALQEREMLTGEGEVPGSGTR